MSGEFDGAIQRILTDIEADEKALLEKKRMVNQLCGYDQRPPHFPDAEAADSISVSAIRPDQFYGQPLATVIRQYLEMRKVSGVGAAAVREIYEALKSGGFKFEAKDENAVRGLRQSLTKNSATFHKLPNGTYGLREWYPNAKAPKTEPQDIGAEPERAVENSEAAVDDVESAAPEHFSESPDHVQS